MAFGVTPTGFNRKLLQDILDDITANQQAFFGALLDTSVETELGQLNNTFASALAECWELLEACYHGFDPDAAADFLLTALAALTGTERRAATATTFTVLHNNALIANLNPGASCPVNSLVSIPGRPDLQFQITVGATNSGGSAADFPVEAVCTQTGAITVIAGSISVIVTPASGWNSITQTHDGTTGIDADTDITLRQRRENELALRGGSTVGAIRADLLDSANHPELVSIRSAEVLENTGDTIDGNGLPPHSFEAVIDDGDTPTVAANDVAQAIFDSKPAGIVSSGSISGTALDDNGDPQIEKFSRVTLLPVYMTITLTVDATVYPADGDTQVRTAIVALGATQEIHQDVIALRYRSACLAVAGVIDVPSLLLGFAPAPVSSANLSVGVRSRATFASGNIGVTP